MSKNKKGQLPDKKDYSKQDLIKLIEWFDRYDGRSIVSYLIVEDFLDDQKQKVKS